MASILQIGAPPVNYAGRSARPAAAPSGRFGLNPGTGAMMSYLTNLFKPAMNQPGLALLTPAQIKQRAAGYVTSAIDPVESADRTQSARATAGGVGQMTGGTVNAETALAPYADRASAIGNQQAASDTAESGALASFLKGSGADTFGDVASKLKAAGIDAPVGPNMGEGAAGITGAVGIANARAASATGANNAELANLLPGFAGLAGQQAENQFRSDQAGSLADRLSTLEGTVPGLTSQTVNDLTNNETTKANARSSAATNRASALATFLGNSVDDKTQLDLANLSGLFGVQKATDAAAAPSASLSRAYGHPTAKSGASISDSPLPGYTLNPKTGKYEKDVSPASKQSLLRAKQSALSGADRTVRQIVGAAFKTATKKSSASAGPFGSGTTGKPTIGSAPYNMAVNEAVKSLETTLSPYMTHDDIVRFVQERALLTGWAQPKAQTPAAPAAAVTGPDGVKSLTGAFSPAG